MDLVQSVALAGGMAWASGLRLYAVILSAGLLGRFGYLQLPDALQVIQSPWILGLAAVLFVVGKGQRLAMVAKGIIMTPVRYAMILADTITIARFAGDLWITGNRKWRK